MEGKDIPFFEVIMGNGTPCDLKSNTPRLTRVKYICDKNGRGDILSLKETSTCEYEAILFSAHLCSHPLYRWVLSFFLNALTFLIHLSLAYHMYSFPLCLTLFLLCISFIQITIVVVYIFSLSFIYPFLSCQYLSWIYFFPLFPPYISFFLSFYFSSTTLFSLPSFISPFLHLLSISCSCPLSLSSFVPSSFVCATM